MNIFLIPHTWARHVAPALVVAGSALLAWWLFLAVEVGLGPALFRMGLLWRQDVEGPLLMVWVASVISFASLFVEGSLLRRSLAKRLGYAVLAGVLTFFLGLLFYAAAHWLVVLLSSEGMRPLVRDPSVVTLKHRGVLWGACGLAAGLGPWLVRKVVAMVARRLVARLAERRQSEAGGDSSDAAAALAGLETSRGGTFGSHVVGGVAAASIGAAVWDGLGYYGLLAGADIVEADLYLSAGLGFFTWGLVHGLLSWGIPSELYAGWIRILSTYRFGHRIPIDRPDGSPAERFVGHFPRGLDIYIPADRGVAELHTSFVRDVGGRYAVRGLSVQKTLVKRFLESVKIHYNPRRPAPLETSLSMEDRVIMSDGANETVVEFILLPKEER